MSEINGSTYSDYIARKAVLQSRLVAQQKIEKDLSAPTQLSTFKAKCWEWYRAFPNVTNAARLYYAQKGLRPRQVDHKTNSTSIDVFNNAKKRGLKVPHFTNFQNV